MSFHVQAIPDQAGMYPVLMFSPTVLALKCPDPNTYSRYREVSERVKVAVKVAAHCSGGSA